MNQTAQTSIIVIAIGLRLIWLAVELRQRRRFPIEPNSAMDKHSGKAWDISQLLELVGLVLGLAGVARFGNTLSQIAGLVLLSVGMAIRFAAINELGNFFSSLVTIRANHQSWIPDPIALFDTRHMRVRCWRTSASGCRLVVGLALAVARYRSSLQRCIECELKRQHSEERWVRSTLIMSGGRGD